jgi:hypothetical protein
MEYLRSEDWTESAITTDVTGNEFTLTSEILKEVGSVETAVHVISWGIDKSTVVL